MMMREILFRGKHLDTGNWVKGSMLTIGEESWIVVKDDGICGWKSYNIDPATVGQYTGQKDKNGKRIFEMDIVQYNTYDDFDCHAIVKFGEYKQDGSGGEYSGRKCVGFYVNVDNFTCPDWCDNEPERFPDHMWQQNLLEVARECDIIGNIHDNPELVERESNDERKLKI